jgi:hypothetical protein
VAPLPGSYAELRAVGQNVITAELDRWRDAFPDVPVDERVLPGGPAATLVAASARARLLVVGAGAAVPHVVLDQALCPVAIVHPHRHAAAAGERDAVTTRGGTP